MRTFRQKIFIGYGASLVLMVLILAWAMFMMLRLGRASESILRENYRSIQAAEHMIDALDRQDSAVLLYLLGYREQGLKEFRSLRMISGPILIVDDEKNIRLALSMSLEKLDIPVETAASGEEALEKVAQDGYELMLLDLRMPGMDGMEVLRRVSRQLPELKVIIGG